MRRRTQLGLGVLVLGVVVIAAVAVAGPTATCRSTNGDIAGLSGLQFEGLSHGTLRYSRDGGASICSISLSVLGVPAGLVVIGFGLLVLRA